MSTNIPFDSIVVGDELGPWLVEVTPEVIAQYCADWDDPNPLYLRGSSDGGPPIAPPAFMAGLASHRLLGRKFDTRSTVNVQSEQVYLKPFRVGQTLRSEGRVVDKYVKRGLEYVVVEYAAYDADDQLIRESRDHILLGLEPAGRPDGHYNGPEADHWEAIAK